MTFVQLSFIFEDLFFTYSCFPCIHGMKLVRHGIIINCFICGMCCGRIESRMLETERNKVILYSLTTQMTFTEVLWKVRKGRVCQSVSSAGRSLGEHGFPWPPGAALTTTKPHLAAEKKPDPSTWHFVRGSSFRECSLVLPDSLLHTGRHETGDLPPPVYISSLEEIYTICFLLPVN